MKGLLSKRHPLVSQLYELRSSRSARQEHRQLAIFGQKLIREWLSQKGQVHAILRTQACPAFGESDQIVDEKAFEWACGMVTSPKEACGAILSMPQEGLPQKAQLVLVLDGVQDPGNVGTLIRSALAFDFDAAILLEPSCDPWNDKALRASVGSALYLPLWRPSKELFFQALKERGAQLFVAEASASSQDVLLQSFIPPRQSWLAIGHETCGISQELAEKGRPVHLSISPKVESLNAAVAGSILAHLFASKRAL